MNKKYALTLSCITFCVFLGMFLAKNQIKNCVSNLKNNIGLQKLNLLTTSNREPWITVFVHGTFASALTLMSPSSVLSDDLRKSNYRKVSKRMRKDPAFYQEQPILQRGLVSITPTFEKTCSTEISCAAYPLIKAYQLIQKTVAPEKELNHFYTFGWSGLLSQYARRKAAIRLYNNLAEELAKFEHKGVKPKIRIVAHSHGGTLSLNLAAVSHLLHTKNIETPCEPNTNCEKEESLKKMALLFKDLTNLNQAKTQKGQKRFDYVPEFKDLKIEELILFGTPVQPETECFCQSTIFKKIFSFYSQEDNIQSLDFVTTKAYSTKRLSSSFLTRDSQDHKTTQIRIMCKQNSKDLNKHEEQHEKKSFSVQNAFSIIQKLFSQGKIFTKQTNDPNHKELWFICPREKEDDKQFILNPIPVMVLTPLLTNMCDKQPDINDLDINITSSNQHVTLSLFKHNEPDINHEIKIPIDLIKSIQGKLASWLPKKFSETQSFDASCKHLM